MAARLTPAEAKRLAADPSTPAALRDLLTKKIRSGTGAPAPRSTAESSPVSDSPTSRADAFTAEIARHGLGDGVFPQRSSDADPLVADADVAARADAFLAEAAAQGLSLDSDDNDSSPGGASPASRADDLLAELAEQGLSFDGATRREDDGE
jgi:hypothetical protein